MPAEDPDSPNLPRLLSVPGLMALAIFGILVIVVSRLFGPENILREIVTELLASFGSTILLLAIFGFFFRTGVQRLLRWAPGGETFQESAERLRELLQDFDVRGRESEGSQDGEKLDRIEVGVRTLSTETIPRLENEIQELRKMLSDPTYGGRDQTSE
jgi:ABC-type multidrug transport system fused ATPase/permease subunit